jgi:hypothetical protein
MPKFDVFSRDLNHLCNRDAMITCPRTRAAVHTDSKKQTMPGGACGDGLTVARMLIS